MANVTRLKELFPAVAPRTIKEVLSSVGGNLAKAADRLVELGANKEGSKSEQAKEAQPVQQKSPKEKDKDKGKRKELACVGLLAGLVVWMAAYPGKVWKERTTVEKFVIYVLFTKLELEDCKEGIIAAQLAACCGVEENARFIARQLLRPHKLTTMAVKRYAKVLALTAPRIPHVLDLLLERIRYSLESTVVSNARKKVNPEPKKQYTWGAPTVEGQYNTEKLTASEERSVQELNAKKGFQKTVSLCALLGELTELGSVSMAVTCETILMICCCSLKNDHPTSTLRIHMVTSILAPIQQSTPFLRAVLPTFCLYCTSKMPLSPDVLGGMLQALQKMSPENPSIEALGSTETEALLSTPYGLTWLRYISHMRDTSQASDGSLSNLTSRTSIWPISAPWAVTYFPLGTEQAANPPDATATPAAPPRGRGRTKNDENSFLKSLFDATVTADVMANKDETPHTAGRGRGRGTRMPGVTQGVIKISEVSY